MNALDRAPGAVSDADVDYMAARLRQMARTDPQRYAAIVADLLAAEAEDAAGPGADVIDLDAARAARVEQGRRRARPERPQSPGEARRLLAEIDATRARLVALVAAEDAARPRLRLVRDE